MTPPRRPHGVDSTLHLLHRAGQYAEELFERSHVGHSLTARQYIVLSIVADSDNPSQTDICNRSGIDRSTVADMVRRLVDRGLLARRRTRKDARTYAIRLTDDGERQLAAAIPAALAVDTAMLGELTSAQRNQFDATLRLILASRPGGEESK